MSASTFPASRYANLSTDLLQLGTNLTKVLGWEVALSNSSLYRHMSEAIQMDNPIKGLRRSTYSVSLDNAKLVLVMLDYSVQRRQREVHTQ